MGSLFRSTEPNEIPIDPLSNAALLARDAEAHARKNKDVNGMLAASTQWLAIAQVHSEITQQEPVQRQVGFTGGNDG